MDVSLMIGYACITYRTCDALRHSQDEGRLAESHEQHLLLRDRFRAPDEGASLDASQVPTPPRCLSALSILLSLRAASPPDIHRNCFSSYQYMCF
jgi:hypothetical protein